jgi:hypothetical protein
MLSLSIGSWEIRQGWMWVALIVLIENLDFGAVFH